MPGVRGVAAKLQHEEAITVRRHIEASIGDQFRWCVITDRCDNSWAGVLLNDWLVSTDTAIMPYGPT